MATDVMCAIAWCRRINNKTNFTKFVCAIAVGGYIRARVVYIIVRIGVAADPTNIKTQQSYS